MLLETLEARSSVRLVAQLQAFCQLEELGQYRSSGSAQKGGCAARYMKAGANCPASSFDRRYPQIFR